MGEVIFVTGTDTGAGKTLVTALLLRHLRGEGINARAVKPFCAGSLADARLLASLQGDDADLSKVSPFVFPKPLAPGAQDYPGEKAPELADAVDFVRRASRDADLLLVEGCGGLMVPLGRHFMILDLIKALQCRAILVAANRLGAINHVLLSMRALESVGCERTRVVLSSVNGGGRAVGRCNEQFLRKNLGEDRVFALKYMGKTSGKPGGFKKNDKRVKKVKKVLVGVTGDL